VLDDVGQAGDVGSAGDSEARTEVIPEGNSKLFACLAKAEGPSDDSGFGRGSDTSTWARAIASSK
jgi:hypothetical protein